MSDKGHRNLNCMMRKVVKVPVQFHRVKETLMTLGSDLHESVLWYMEANSPVAQLYCIN